MTNIFKFKIIFLGFLVFFSTREVLATSLTEVLEEALNSSVQISAASNRLLSQGEGLNQLTAQKKPIISANFSGDRDWDLKDDDETNSFSAGITARYVLFDGNLTIIRFQRKLFVLKLYNLNLKR